MTEQTIENRSFSAEHYFIADILMRAVYLREMYASDETQDVEKIKLAKIDAAKGRIRVNGFAWYDAFLNYDPERMIYLAAISGEDANRYLLRAQELGFVRDIKFNGDDDTSYAESFTVDDNLIERWQDFTHWID